MKIYQQLEKEQNQMFTDDGGYEVDPTEEAAWQASLELERSQTHIALNDWGDDVAF